MKTSIITAVGSILFQGDKVLLVKHGEAAEHITGIYGFPSGRVKKNENLKQAAIRELEEETGLKTSEADLSEYPNNFYTALINRKGGIKVKASIKIFICKNYFGELKTSEETIPQWLKINELTKYNLLPNIEKAVQDAFNYL